MVQAVEELFARHQMCLSFVSQLGMQHVLNSGRQIVQYNNQDRVQINKLSVDLKLDKLPGNYYKKHLGLKYTRSLQLLR